jgi:hypothetical protein
VTLDLSIAALEHVRVNTITRIIMVALSNLLLGPLGEGLLAFLSPLFLAFYLLNSSSAFLTFMTR